MGSQFSIPEELRHDFQGWCWWCGERPADSREHRYKRTDLTQVFGVGAWLGDNAVVRGGPKVSAARTNVQGPNSKRVKFDRVLCEQCNNVESQSFDLAYSRFTSYVDKHADSILASNSFYFSDIYGIDWPAYRAQLIRYLIKHVGCRFAEHGIQLPRQLVRYLSSESTYDPPHLSFTMTIRLDMAEIMEHQAHEDQPPGGLSTGGLAYSADRRSVAIASSFLAYNWLRIAYEMNSTTARSVTNFDTDLVVLPAESSVNLEEIRAMCSVCNPA